MEEIGGEAKRVLFLIQPFFPSQKPLAINPSRQANFFSTSGFRISETKEEITNSKYTWVMQEHYWSLWQCFFQNFDRFWATEGRINAQKLEKYQG